MRRIIVNSFSLLLISSSILAQEARTVFQHGEELQYKVKWSFFRIGTIIIRTQRDTSSAESTQYRVVMIVESNPDLFFVKVHDYNESLMSTTNIMSKIFSGKHCNGNNCHEIHFTYDEVQRRVFYSETSAKEKLARTDTLNNAPPYVDGASLFFFTRVQSHSGKVLNVPTMASGEIRNTMLDFTGPIEDIEIGASNFPIRTQRYTGVADWKGGTSAGLTGEFTGWISDDSAAIPIQAEMKVFLGSVRLELEKWHRPGWVPPCTIRTAKQ